LLVDFAPLSTLKTLGWPTYFHEISGLDIRVAPDQHMSLAALDAVRQVLRNSPHTAESPHRIHIGVNGCFDADPMSTKPYIETSIDQQLRQIKEILRTEAPEADVQDMLSQCELPRGDALPVSWSGLMKFTIAILPEGSLANAPWIKDAVCSGSRCSLT
jgi:hypothetical protein